MTKAMVRVIEVQSGECLFETQMEHIDLAYKYASEMEEHGIDVKITSPSLPETLGMSLGATSEQQEALRRELQDEMDSHDSACSSCVTSLRAKHDSLPQ